MTRQSAETGRKEMQRKKKKEREGGGQEKDMKAEERKEFKEKIGRRRRGRS
jgi:hypothetical protein